MNDIEQYTGPISEPLDYHRDYSHLSQSMLKVLDESPAQFHARFIAQTMEDEDTADKKLGRVIHAFMLERDRFDELCPRMPAFESDPENVTKGTEKRPGKRSYSKTTDYYQTKKKEWEAQHAGCDSIDDETYAQVIAIEQAIRKHDDALAILTAKGEHEVVHRWHDRVDRRCKMDIVRPRNAVIADIKTLIGPPTPLNFARACAKFRHWLQPPYYIDAADDLYGPQDWRFLFICVNKNEPQEVAIHELTSDDADWAEKRVEDLVTEYMARMETGNWQADWQREINVVPLPSWVKSSYWSAENGDSDNA
jgi:hypothetical protein